MISVDEDKYDARLSLLRFLLMLKPSPGFHVGHSVGTKAMVWQHTKEKCELHFYIYEMAQLCLKPFTSSE